MSHLNSQFNGSNNFEFMLLILVEEVSVPWGPSAGTQALVEAEEEVVAGSWGEGSLLIPRTPPGPACGHLVPCPSKVVAPFLALLGQ